MFWKRSNPNRNGSRRDKVALRTTYNKNVKFKIIKIRAVYQYVGYFYYSQNLNWAAKKLRLDRGLDIAGLAHLGKCSWIDVVQMFANFRGFYILHAKAKSKNYFCVFFIIQKFMCSKPDLVYSRMGRKPE